MVRKRGCMGRARSGWCRIAGARGDPCAHCERPLRAPLAYSAAAARRHSRSQLDRPSARQSDRARCPLSPAAPRSECFGIHTPLRSAATPSDTYVSGRRAALVCALSLFSTRATPYSLLLHPTHYSLLPTQYQLLNTHCSMLSTLTTHLSPLTTHISPLTTHLLPLNTHLSPLTTHCSPLTTHHPPHTAHRSLATRYPLLIAMPAPPSLAQAQRRPCCDRPST